MNLPFSISALSRIMTLSLLAAATITAAQVPGPDPALEAQLRRDDQTLLKAVHTGDREAWKRLTAPDFFYLDEEGQAIYLSSFLNELAPMSTKPLEIRSYSLTRAGDTAIVLHGDTDQNNVQYTFSETWQLLDGDWKLRVLSITNVLSDPPTIQLTAAQIDELVGTYTSGSQTCHIRREGHRLLRQEGKRPPVELKAETRDVLFTPGRPRMRNVFLRDRAGKVTSYAVRYESSDTIWTKH